MNTLAIEVHPAAETVHFSESELMVTLADGRTISVPIAWFSSLSNATEQELHNYELLGNGEGIHWPQLDEDLSVKGLLLGFH
ncbi:DUF2442 domain-containing protein [Mariprofundus sp. EBB-1]|uniref:DUF2442 domain-containing protein n=1 Tax=Mariprofundus sp. EBB-1 TaxID=2650971 RepID=UPI000EF215F4|nr:DUF2442 domain-containing protein [Mariprofundus sp. EBB-1]RLL50871.1 DUF2442 domain-containing protein [Mariprofundus sp. EBB-1]